MPQSTFISKIEAACLKKEALFDQSKGKYALRSIFAGAFLTFSTGAGAIAADLINKIVPGFGRFLFPFIFAWGLAYIVFLNAELVTSNMMFLTAGSYLKKISWKKSLSILLFCTFFNLVGTLIVGWAFANSAAYATLSHDSFIVGVVETKLARTNDLVLLEGIIANIFVNIAILSFILVKDGTAKLCLVLSAIYMFVFLTNEHLAANFASFSIVKFSVVADQVAHFDFLNILRHWGVTFLGNLIGGGILIGLPYAWLNSKQTDYVDE
ncbi:Formate-nitrate transporter [Streptococcus sp. DD10]|uniref:formate/nitrite transporter family protein n=1 Tax=Streptococcus sp. DD10 TaxID=1777878 RepID=UPI0007980BF4|nr:formate/nitrite transporter family protein [Streptococcus sp. DD10]KXT74070.1 Formate-nitrate transporter [Streptococcus sp. DD10]